MIRSNLRVDVHDPYILVALRGTCFRAKYRRQDAPWLATDEYGPEDLMCIFFPEWRQSQPRYDNWPACMHGVMPPLAAASLRPAPAGLGWKNSCFGRVPIKPKFGIGTAKQSAVVPLPRRLKKLPRGNGLLKLNTNTRSAETTPAPRAEAEFRGKGTDLVLDLPRRGRIAKRNTDGRA